MNASVHSIKHKQTSSTNSSSSLLLQRKCDCGGNPKLSGKCAECEKGALIGLQAKLQIGAIDDVYEREADRIASKVMAKESLHARDSEPIPVSSVPVVRKRSTQDSNNQGAAPPIVHQVLRSSGEPLNATARQDMEARFGRDFSGVKVHTDSQAAASAASVGAKAYTVGNNIVFGSGTYTPTTFSGKELLAHELVHTIQQGNALGSERLSRKGGSFGGFFRNIGRGIAGLVGLEPKYDEETLNTYLEVLKNTSDIEDDFDSDNKARAVVLQGLYSKLSVQIRVLLVKELLSGFTGDDDEQAILILLENAASLKERESIAEKVTYAALYDNFHGKELDSLYALLPMLKTFHPREEKETTVHTLQKYIKKWEKDKGRKITAQERLVLARGCIGITTLQLGRQKEPKLTLCYGSFERSWMAARSMNEYLAQFFPHLKAFIFSKRFWSGGKDYSPDPKTGKVDMSQYDYSPKPGYVNFDYGFYDEVTNKWWHANHCAPSILGVSCKGAEARKKNLPDPMKVYESNLQHYSRPLNDFDSQVFCIGVAKV